MTLCQTDAIPVSSYSLVCRVVLQHDQYVVILVGSILTTQDLVGTIAGFI
jgi:hypothetical protein